ncbi:L,D-transpeptidase [Rhizobiaceae bacterium]|nr:L,D-transpeptidase [Rhizobiaceae bacterium]
MPRHLTTPLLLAALASGSCLALSPALAGERYATPPPLVLSPDLTSPWTLQLKSRHARPVAPKRSASRSAWTREKPRAVVRSGAYVRDASAPRTAEDGLAPELLPQMVAWHGSERPGTLIVDTPARRLFLVMKDGRARRYAIGVGKPGFEWAGSHKVTRKAEWPSWRPPQEMIVRERAKGRELPTFMEGGPENPLGARALYLGSSIYRIHGTNQAWSIGQAVSSGCIRMRNQDVMDLYERVPVGAQVRVI